MEDFSNSGSKEIVGLNIGGIKYLTTKTTLLSTSEPNFFTSLLSGSFLQDFDTKGNYFIDRDGQYFAPILEYLRTGEFRCPQGMNEKAIAREANFYFIKIPSLTFDMDSPQLRTDGIYFSESKDKLNWIIFGNEGTGFHGSLAMEFQWTKQNFLINISFEAKDEIVYSEGVIYKKKRFALLFDNGIIYDIDGNALRFHASGEYVPSALYSFEKEPLSFTKQEKISHILFLTTPASLTNSSKGENLSSSSNLKQGSTEEGPNIALLWDKNWSTASFSSSKFFSIDLISINFVWSTTKIEILPLQSALLVRKSVANDKSVHPFLKFVLTSIE